MEDDYYYDDDGGYDEYYDNGADEVVDMDPLEVKYVDGKSFMQSNVGESLRCLQEVMAEDNEHGKWTFKALRMLARASRIAKKYDAMTDYYTRVVHFTHPDIGAAAVAKAMLKFTEESQQVPAEWRGRTLHVTLEVATAQPESYRDVIVPTLLRRATLFVEEAKYEEALLDLQAALQKCDESGVTTAQANTNSVYHIRTLQLTVYRKLSRYAELRRAYYELDRVQAALPSLRMIGSVMESAGHLFLHDADWAAAHRAFSLALRCHTESGCAQQYSVIKYIVLAAIMDGTPTDVFAQEETLANHSSVHPVRTLWQAFIALDISTFLHVLRAPANAVCFTKDAEFAPYVEPMMFQLRTNYLISYSKSFGTLSLLELGARLQLQEQPCKELCTSAILLGLIDARIDDSRKLLLFQRASRTVPSSVAVLRDLSGMTSELCCMYR
ncbi:putative PCI domain containing protein [Leishmania naiffi]|uniref:PCI domain containing protein n=1 Tax=Leishmania naiffi TaxID=5678 RepID=A0AAW3BQM8_9TRYP